MIRETITVEDQGNLTIGRFNGLADLADYVKDEPFDAREKWAGATRAQALKRAISGNPDLVAQSDAMLAKLEGITPPPASAFEAQRAVVGGVPSVPDFLSGNPLNMRLRRRVEAQHAPLAIVLDCMSSGGVDNATIARRGAAVMALARNLSASRPVTIWVVAGMSPNNCGSAAMIIPVDSAPLDLARAAWALGAPEMSRQLCYTAGAVLLGQSRTGSTGWCFNDDSWHQSSLIQTLAPMLADRFIAVGSVLLGTTFNTDENAAQWVRDTLLTVRED
jgi:hypothetical protein